MSVKALRPPLPYDTQNISGFIGKLIYLLTQIMTLSYCSTLNFFPFFFHCYREQKFVDFFCKFTIEKNVFYQNTKQFVVIHSIENNDKLAWWNVNRKMPYFSLLFLSIFGSLSAVYAPISAAASLLERSEIIYRIFRITRLRYRRLSFLTMVGPRR